ncbi:hypothetical protein DL95DRAFT_86856 [Leptodontidium sp. 2 PMI_412]|nr:hypothetical protein DL95DRAFT_86856 [Leptodontidium sp. 2 PMI_412]
MWKNVSMKLTHTLSHRMRFLELIQVFVLVILSWTFAGSLLSKGEKGSAEVEAMLVRGRNSRS